MNLLSDHHLHRMFTFLLIAISTSTLQWIIYKQIGSDIIIIINNITSPSAASSSPLTGRTVSHRSYPRPTGVILLPQGKCCNIISSGCGQSGQTSGILNHEYKPDATSCCPTMSRLDWKEDSEGRRRDGRRKQERRMKKRRGGGETV